MSPRLPKVVLAMLGLGGAALLIVAPFSSSSPADGRPNIIVIVTDDQTLSELNAVPHTKSLIGGAGVTFSRFYVSYPLCCPSRASLLTGQYAHNHGVHGNLPPSGGVTAFNDSQTVPVWLHAAGYTTVQIGKYLNGYGAGRPPFVPPGWDEWYGKMGSTNGVPSENRYFDYSMYEKGPVGSAQLVNYGSARSDYQTDVYRQKAVDAIQRLGGAGTGQPFYMNLSFGAPHFPFTRAPRDKGALRGVKLSKLPGYNERDLSDKPKFMRVGAKSIGPLTRRGIDKRRRWRLEQLISVDEAISSIFAALSATGQLANTDVIFTSDNGYFFGEHRIYRGKYLPHDPATHLPFMIRGPGLPAGATSGELSANIDVAPTLVDIAGPAAQAAVPPGFFDGRSILPFAANPGMRSARPILLEANRGVSDLEQDPFASTAKLNHNTLTTISAPAYSGIRTNRYELIQYADGSQELYDMLRDPAQVHSVRGDRRYRAVKAFLLGRLATLNRCHGSACGQAIPPDPLPAGNPTSRLKDGRGG